MSQYWDFVAGDGASVDTSIGPQTDGTNIPSGTAATIPTPTDTAGGAPAQYGQAVLDVFKYGIGAYTATVQQQNMLDYKRYEATNGGLFQQGRAATLPKASTGGASGLVLMGVAAVVVFALLTHKG